MGVPFIDIKRFENGFIEKWMSKVDEMSRKASFIGGEEVAKLEKALSEYNSVSHTVTCANGTDALQLALRAVGVKKGDKVLLPDSTFWATYEAIVNVSGEPITIDIDKTDLQMSFTEFEKAVEKYKPKAAMIVHLYGWGSARLSDFREFCTKKNIPLIEDGAQSFGVLYKGNSIYKDAYIATTSFYPAKVLGAAGDGGAVFTNHAELADTVRKLANHGRTAHYGHGYVGWNSRMDSLQAAYVNLSLEVFSARLKSRQDWTKRYQIDLKQIGLNVISPPKDYTENGYCNVNLLPNESKLKLEEQLKSKGIGFGNIYPGAMSDQPGAKEYLAGQIGGENAREVCKTVLNLPLFPYMKEEEYKEIIELVKSFQLG